VIARAGGLRRLETTTPRPGESQDPFIDSTMVRNGYRLSPVRMY
jgi:hypothetical protein